MFFRKINLIISIFIINIICLASDHSILVSPESRPTIESNHWRHDATNSALDKGKLEIDIFEWRVISKLKETVKVEIVDEKWEFAGWNNNNLEL